MIPNLPNKINTNPQGKRRCFMKHRIFLLLLIPSLILAVELNEGATIWTQDQGFFRLYREINVRALEVDSDVIIWGKEVELPSRVLVFDPFNYSLAAQFNEFDITLAVANVDDSLLATDIFTKDNIGSQWNLNRAGVKRSVVNSFHFHDALNICYLVAATEAGVYQSTNGGRNWSGVKLSELNSNIFDVVLSPVNQSAAGFAYNKYFAATYDGVYQKLRGTSPFDNWEPLTSIIEEQDFEDVDTMIAGYLDSLPDGWIQTGTEDTYNYVRLDTVSSYSGEYSLLIHSSGLGGSNVAAEYQLPDVSNIICTFQFRPLTHSGIIRIKNGLELKVAYSYGKMRYYDTARGWVIIDDSGVNSEEFNEIKLFADFEDSSGVIITPSSEVNVKLSQASDDTSRIVFSSEDYGYGSEPYWIEDVSIQLLVYALAPHRDSIDYVYAATREGVYFYNDSIWSKSLDVKDDWFKLERDLKGNYMIAASPSQVYISDNEGTSWNDISGSIPDINDIYVDMNGIVYAATDSFPYRYDGSWTQLSNGFLEYGIMGQVKVCEAITMIEPDTIIVGNHNGMYFSVDGGSNWFEDNEGIEPYPIDSGTIAEVDAYFEDAVPSDPTTGLFELLIDKLGDIPDVDNDLLLHVVLLDIYEDGFDENPAYFDPTNEDTLVQYSNGMELIYVDVDDDVGWSDDPEYVKKKIIGSMAEMIHWNYDPDEDDWVKIGVNEYARYLVYYGDGNIVPKVYGVPQKYITRLSGTSIFTFYVYLYENYGGNDFISDLIQSPYNGFSGLDSVLVDNGYFTNHDTVFLDWEASCVFDNFSLIDVSYYPDSVSNSWDPRVFNEKDGYKNEVLVADSSKLENDSLFFDADDYLDPYLKVIRCSSVDTISEFISLNSYNEAFIALDYPEVYLFPLLTEAGDYLIDTKPWSFLPPRNLEVINDYREDTVELAWEEPVVGEKGAKNLLNFDLYRSINDTTSFSLLTPVDTTFYLDNIVYNESTYYYYVHGVYADGMSPPSNMVAGHPTQFPPPADFRTMGGDSVVTLFWTLPDSGRKELIKNLKSSSDSKGLIGFRLYRKLISDTYFNQIESLYVGTYYNDTPVMNDTTYIYGIRSLYESPSGMSPVIQCNVTTLSGGLTAVPEFRPITTGDLWSVVSNRGQFGDPNSEATGNPSYYWPGKAGNFYLWEGRLWFGTMQDGTPYVSHADYGNYELNPEGWGWNGPGKSDFDIVSSYYDWVSSNSGRAIGIKVIQRALSWSSGHASHIIAYEFDVIYDKTKSDIGLPAIRDSFYFSITFDADVSEADPLDACIDDLVSYDGWTNAEWNTLTHYPSPSDDYTILQDTTLPVPDGTPDQVCLFGDDLNENTILGDTQWVWRDMSFILDGDNPNEIGNDSTDNGLSAGFIFASMLYAPKSPNDSIWIDGVGDTCRLARPTSHQWWNWNNDPGTDVNKFDFMTGEHLMSLGYRFLPHPYDLEADVFDYRFLLTYGPYSIVDGDTIHFVLATGVGQGLNGGEDLGYGRGYLPGARQLRDYALMMYYEGSTHSDPYHPSAPMEDIHWNYYGTGIEEEILEDKLTLNNSVALNGTLLLELQLKERNRVEIEIYDKCGRRVKKLKDTFNPGKGTLVIPLHSLSSGVYFVRGKVDGEVISREKVVLVR